MTGFDDRRQQRKSGKDNKESTGNMRAANHVYRQNTRKRPA